MSNFTDAQLALFEAAVANLCPVKGCARRIFGVPAKELYAWMRRGRAAKKVRDRGGAVAVEQLPFLALQDAFDRGVAPVRRAADLVVEEFMGRLRRRGRKT